MLLWGNWFSSLIRTPLERAGKLLKIVLHEWTKFRKRKRKFEWRNLTKFHEFSLFISIFEGKFSLRVLRVALWDTWEFEIFSRHWRNFHWTFNFQLLLLISQHSTEHYENCRIMQKNVRLIHSSCLPCCCCVANAHYKSPWATRKSWIHFSTSCSGGLHFWSMTGAQISASLHLETTLSGILNWYNAIQQWLLLSISFFHFPSNKHIFRFFNCSKCIECAIQTVVEIAQESLELWMNGNFCLESSPSSLYQQLWEIRWQCRDDDGDFFSSKKSKNQQMYECRQWEQRAESRPQAPPTDNNSTKYINLFIHWQHTNEEGKSDFRFSSKARVCSSGNCSAILDKI